MRVSSVNSLQFYQNRYDKKTYNAPSFEAVRMRQITPEYYALGRVLENELDMFVKTGDNAELLGQGLSAAVYKLKNFQDIVFKKSLGKNTDFADEMRHLKSLPQRLNTVQKFVGQAFDDVTGKFYLLSTRMSGKPADAKTNPWTIEHLKSLFRTFFILDKNGIYHGDFNPGNILLDVDGKVNLIDFQWTQNLEKRNFFKNKQQSVLPPFVLSENSQMFEMASLPIYLKGCDNAKEFLLTYLKTKAEYHENRAYYLRGIIKNWVIPSERDIILKGIDYEDAQSVVFRHPDNDILKLETKKLQFLSEFREAFSRNELSNPESNFITGGTSHLITLSALQDLRREIARQKSEKHLSSAKQKYLELTDEYAKYWFDSLKSWVNGVFEANISEAERVEHTGLNNKSIEKFGNLTDLSKYVDEDYGSHYTRDFNLAQNTDTVETLNSIKANANTFKRHMLASFIFDSNISKKLSEIKKIDEKIRRAYKNGFGFDVIHLAILNVIKNRELKRIIVHKPNVRNRDDLITDLHHSKLMYEGIARQNFKYMLQEIVSDTPENNRLTGYANMVNFE